MNQDNNLFQRNIDFFLKSNPHFAGKLDYNLAEAKLKRDSCNSEEELKLFYKNIQSNVIQYPNQMIRDSKIYKALLKQYGCFKIGADIKQYYDLPGYDPHLAILLAELREAVIDIGFDITDNERSLNSACTTFISFGTGDAYALLALLSKFKPFNLIIAVESNFNDYISSFWSLDWKKISDYFTKENRKLKIIKINNSEKLRLEITSMALLNLEQAICYVPESSSPKLKKIFKEASDIRTANIINHLGFTLDELNMVINSVDTLKKSPRVFTIPKQACKLPFLVCGSGPSLDKNIDEIRTLSDSHVIIASGSNYQSLLSNGIQPDYLCLNERALNTYDDYKLTYEKYGKTQTRLVISSTCPSGLVDLFDDSVIFFRPALAPVALFSDANNEIMVFEGPEAVNTSISFACHHGASSIVLFGVDLGTASRNKLRSDSANGITPRFFNKEKKGNFSDTVWTSNELIGVGLAMTDCLQKFSQIYPIKGYNCSDGLKIEGYKPMKGYQYIKSKSSKNKDLLILDEWWSSLSCYTSHRLKMNWQSRSPRRETYKLSRRLIEIFETQPWFPNVINDLTAALNLDVEHSKQFPRRIMHSTIYKGALAVTQQLYCMMGRSSPEALNGFIIKARSILATSVINMEKEIYQLCDACDVSIDE